MFRMANIFTKWFSKSERNHDHKVNLIENRENEKKYEELEQQEAETITGGEDIQSVEPLQSDIDKIEEEIAENEEDIEETLENEEKSIVEEETEQFEEGKVDEILEDIKDLEECEKSDSVEQTEVLQELLEKDKATLKQAIADISHQLKTPLTSLYLCNEILCDESDPHQREVFLDKMRQELERIEWLISSLLKMSKLDSKTIILKKEKINVSNLIDSTLLSLSSVIDSKDINIVKEGSDDITIAGDFNWLREALSNVIKNGVEHTESNGQKTISYSDNPLYVELDIKDNGEGIAKSDLPYIFERFYKAKGSSKESVGIGLSLSKTIINNSNGDISVRSKKNEYTLFTIKIYKNEL
jgi:signal transduction histidine kinase